MIKFKIGQKVKALDDDTHGVITKIEGEEIWIENEDGFDEVYAFNQLLPDIGLEEEIEMEDEPVSDVPSKKTSFNKKKKKVAALQAEESTQEEQEFKELVEKNLVKNTDAYKEKLEEKYKKEIKKNKKRKGTFVLDLHYGNLESYSKQLPTSHILQKQLTAAINGIEKAKNDGFKKIILVHGKGKGVLEREVKKYLAGYGYTFYDADFKQYKLGATEVEL